MKTTSATDGNLLDDLRRYGLTPEIISVQAGCDINEVHKVLHPKLFETCPLIVVAKVRSTVELGLAARGWKGDKDQLWEKFNARLRQLAGYR